jgi:hypothetical protein
MTSGTGVVTNPKPASGRAGHRDDARSEACTNGTEQFFTVTESGGLIGFGQMLFLKKTTRGSTPAATLCADRA